MLARDLDTCLARVSISEQWPGAAMVSKCNESLEKRWNRLLLNDVSNSRQQCGTMTYLPSR